MAKSKERGEDLRKASAPAGAELEPFGRRRLTCPSCGETLIQPDIEFFSSCPYCDYKFARTPELEDFLLEPTVRAWVRNQEALPAHMRDPE